MNDEKMRKIKRVAIWGGLLFLMVLVINAVVKCEVEKMSEEDSEEKDLIHGYGATQYSDSIVINPGWEKVYNINTQTYLHQEEIEDFLSFDEVAESKIVYVDSAYK
jgi:hypothetical protein